MFSKKKYNEKGPVLPGSPVEETDVSAGQNTVPETRSGTYED